MFRSYTIIKATIIKFITVAFEIYFTVHQSFLLRDRVLRRAFHKRAAVPARLSRGRSAPLLHRY